MRKSIVILKSMDVNYSEIARRTNIPFNTVKRVITGETELDKARFEVIEALHKYVVTNENKYNTLQIAKNLAGTFEWLIDNNPVHKPYIYFYDGRIKLNPNGPEGIPSEIHDGADVEEIFTFDNWEELQFEYEEDKLENARIDSIKKAIDDYLSTL